MSGLPDFLHLRTTAFPPSTSPFSAPPPCVPSPTKLVPVTIHFPDPQLDDMRTLLRLSPLAPPTFENSQPRFGQATRDWVASAREAWLDPERFDWRTGAEAKLNALPNFMVTVRDDMLGYEFKLHFVALFSSQSTAVPIVLMHGWPGSILEFLPLLSLLLERYPDAGELPYHVVVPSLPGFGLSGAPPVDRDFTLADLTRVMDAFMVGLGFGRKDSGGGGYVAQGGDIGSMVARMLAKYSNCRAIHGSCTARRYKCVPCILRGQRRYASSCNGLTYHSNSQLHGSRPRRLPVWLDGRRDSRGARPPRARQTMGCAGDGVRNDARDAAGHDWARTLIQSVGAVGLVSPPVQDHPFFRPLCHFTCPLTSGHAITARVCRQKDRGEVPRVARPAPPAASDRYSLSRDALLACQMLPEQPLRLP